MKYNFDQAINRKNTNSIKHDFALEYRKPEDALPLWVADMDFRAPDEVVEALRLRSLHGIFGYTETKSDYFATLKTWFAENFSWEIQEDWLIKTPGVVFAICTAIRALTQKGDAVMIQRPVYYPFSASIWDNERKLVNSPLVYRDGRYEMDFDDFERKIAEHQVKLFILCSPHNPVGRVWTKEELTRVGDLCVKHNVFVVSDEIHADFVYPGRSHHVFSQLKPAYQDIAVVCTSPSKTFNLAGLQVSNIFIPNPKIYRKFKRAMKKAGYIELNAMGSAACLAAYAHGGEWLAQLKKYLAENLAYVREFLAEHIPEIRLVEPEGSYLIWLDFSAFGLKEEELEDLVLYKAKLWLDAGTMFGPEGTGFQRVNIACPRATLEKAFLHLAAAIEEMKCERSLSGAL